MARINLNKKNRRRWSRWSWEPPVPSALWSVPWGVGPVVDQLDELFEWSSKTSKNGDHPILVIEEKFDKNNLTFIKFT